MERKLIYYIASSLDGFIAREDGSVDWLHDPALEVEGDDFGFAEFYEGIGTTLMGWQTYETVLGFNLPFPYTDKVNYVFSQQTRPDQPHVQVVKDDLLTFVRKLKQQEGKAIWLVGGANLGTALLQGGLVDQMILTLAPILIGSGIPLFGKSGNDRYLHLEQVRSFEKGWVELTYDLKSPIS